MEELRSVVEKLKPDGFTPKVIKQVGGIDRWSVHVCVAS
jgi:hypothetical protein